MANQWTNSDQEGWDKKQLEIEADNQKEPEHKSETINILNCDKPKFTARDVILAMIGTGWEDISRLEKNLEYVFADTHMEIKAGHLTEILEEMEGEEIISVYWDTQRVGRNF